MMDIYPLLDFLAHPPPARTFDWKGWHVQRVLSGQNNVLFRARDMESGPERGGADLAVKFTRHDSRDRAGREFTTLSVLYRLGLDLAPAPILLDRKRYPLPVVVLAWMAGESRSEPPADPAEWQRLIDHLAAIHTIVPEYADRPVPHAVMDFSTAREAVDFVLRELEHQPAGSRSPQLIALARRLQETRFPKWPSPEITLGRCDPNIANFLRRDRPWSSVDWEYSGWCDPAFEIGDLMAHPCYAAVTPDRWEWFLSAVADCHPGDDTFLLRVRSYRAVMLVRWAGLLSRDQWERAPGSRGRSATWPETSWVSIPEGPDRYLEMANQALDEIK
jgi:hypothetical protein